MAYYWCGVLAQRNVSQITEILNAFIVYVCIYQFYAVQENTTWDLVADTEKVREHLSIDKWVVIGGSWGSTLSLVYAESHPSRVKALIVNGIFLGTR